MPPSDGSEEAAKLQSRSAHREPSPTWEATRSSPSTRNRSQRCRSCRQADRPRSRSRNACRQQGPRPSFGCPCLRARQLHPQAGRLAKPQGLTSQMQSRFWMSPPWTTRRCSRWRRAPIRIVWARRISRWDTCASHRTAGATSCPVPRERWLRAHTGRVPGAHLGDGLRDQIWLPRTRRTALRASAPSQDGGDTLAVVVSGGPRGQSQENFVEIGSSLVACSSMPSGRPAAVPR